MLALLRRYRAPLALACACLVLSGLVVIGFPPLAGELVSIAFGDERAQTLPLPILGALWFLLAGLHAAFAFAGAVVIARASESMTAELRVSLFAALLSEPARHWTDRTHGDKLARIMNDPGIVGHFLGSAIPGILPQLVASLVAMVILTVREPAFGVVILLAVVPVLLTSRMLGPRLRETSRTSLERHAEATSFVDERLVQLPVLRTVGTGPVSVAQFRQKSDALRRSSLRFLVRQAAAGPVARAIGVVSIYVGFVAVVVPAIDREATAPDVRMLSENLIYALVVLRPSAMLAGMYARLQQARSAFGRLQLIRDGSEFASTGRSSATRRMERPPRPPETAGLVAVDLAFSRPGAKPVLRGASLNLRPGETVLLRGANGSGKTTLAWVLMGLLEPDAGTVWLDGRCGIEIGPDAWSAAFGYLPQQPMLHAGSVRENVLLGRTLSDDAVWRALEAADAARWVTELPGSLDYPLVDRGAGLSGGQQQRLAFARAIVAGPRYLVLDEPTSMLDTDSVSRLLQRHGAWGRGASTLLISHEGALSAIADRTVTLREGRLA